MIHDDQWWSMMINDDEWWWILTYELAWILTYEVAWILTYELAWILTYELAWILTYELAWILTYELAYVWIQYLVRCNRQTLLCTRWEDSRMPLLTVSYNIALSTRILAIHGKAGQTLYHVGDASCPLTLYSPQHLHQPMKKNPWVSMGSSAWV